MSARSSRSGSISARPESLPSLRSISANAGGSALAMRSASSAVCRDGRDETATLQ